MSDDKSAGMTDKKIIEFTDESLAAFVAERTATLRAEVEGARLSRNVSEQGRLEQKARADKAEAEVEELRKDRRSCPICHGDPSTFRAGNQGYGEEDFDINSCRETKWKDGRLVHHCHERCLRVEAEARVATLEKALREIAEHMVGMPPGGNRPLCGWCGLVGDDPKNERHLYDCPGKIARAALEAK